MDFDFICIKTFVIGKIQHISFSCEKTWQDIQRPELKIETAPMYKNHDSGSIAPQNGICFTQHAKSKSNDEYIIESEKNVFRRQVRRVAVAYSWKKVSFILRGGGEEKWWVAWCHSRPACPQIKSAGSHSRRQREQERAPSASLSLWVSGATARTPIDELCWGG